jgi:hypothetical protein
MKRTAARYCPLLPSLLAALPLLYLVLLLARHYVDVPVADQWLLVPMIDRAFRGELTFTDLHSAQYEHRMLFPRLIMIGLALITDWNTGYEIAVTVILAVGTLLALLYQTRLTQQDTGWSRFRWHMPVLALMVFSLGQGENWFCGWQLQFPLTVLSVVLGFTLLSRPEWSLWRYLGAIALGGVATYSLGNGPLYWPLAIALAAVMPWRPRRLKWGAVLGLVGATALLGWWYSRGYLQSTGVPVFMPWDGPVLFLRFTLGFVGGPLSSHLPELFGLGGVLLLIASAWVLIERRGVSFVALAPWLALAAFTVMSGAITAAGRLNHITLANCAASKYQTIGQLLWVASIVLLFMILTPREGDPPRIKWPPRRRMMAVAAAAALVLMTLALIRREIVWAGELKQQGEYRAFLRDLLLGPDEMLLDPPLEIRDEVQAVCTTCWPVDLERVVEQRPVLIERRLSLYRHALPTDKPPGPR